MWILRAPDEVRDLPRLLQADAEDGYLDGRQIAAFVKSWAKADPDARTRRIRRPPRRGRHRDRVVTAAITHGMCVHYNHPPPRWVAKYRSATPVHPINDRNITRPLMRARIIMTASPVCKLHNVWFGESTASAAKNFPPPPRPPHWDTAGARRSRATEQRRHLSEASLLEMFERIDGRLAADGLPVTLTVGGDTAMAFLRDDKTTNDIDVLDRDIDDRVAETIDVSLTGLGHGDGLFDDRAAGYADLEMPRFSAVTVYEGDALTVRRPDMEHLLAMRLVAARDKDLNDAGWLARRLDAADQATMTRILRNVYKHRPDLAGAVEWGARYAAHVAAEIHLQEQLEAVADKPPREFRRRRASRRLLDTTASASPAAHFAVTSPT